MTESSASAQEVTELKRELRLEKTINEHLRLKVTKLQESLDEIFMKLVLRDTVPLFVCTFEFVGACTLYNI